DEVHPAGQRGVGELGQVAARPPGVGAQVQPRVGQPSADLIAVQSRHGVTVPTRPGWAAPRSVGWRCRGSSRYGSGGRTGARAAGCEGAAAPPVDPAPGHAGAGSVTMTTESRKQARVAVVGGGVIGLAVAWRAAVAGHAVTLFDPEPAAGASWVAGGMLAPVAEAWPGEEAVLELGEESLAQWPQFADELTTDGADPVMNTAGTIIAAWDPGDAAQLEVLADYLHRVGRGAELVHGRELRKRVPGLTSRLRAGLVVPGDLAVDNRRLLKALLLAGERRGVDYRREWVEAVGPGTVRTESGEFDCDEVVLAAGARTGALHDELR